MTRPSAAGWLCLALALATSLAYATYWPDSDSWKNLWLIANAAPWQYFSDPLAAGYVYHFYFEPLWTLSYYVDAALAPWLGLLGHHVVNLVAVAVLAGLVRRFAVIAGATPALATGAACVFLASPAAWICVGLATARNYLVGGVFALLAVLPFWRAWHGGPFVGGRVVAASALAYALAIASKEAMAGVPLLVFVLAWWTDRRLGRAVATVIPHAVALALMLAWRWHILGGLGGYWMETPVRWSNLLVAPGVFAELQWSTPWPAVLVGGALAFRPRLVAMALVAHVAFAAPLALAGDFTAGALHPYGAVRLVVLGGVWLGLAAAALAAPVRRWRTTLPLAALAAAVLLGLQLRQAPAAERGLSILTPHDRLPATGAMVAASDHSMALTFEHQLRGPNRASLTAYQTVPTYQIDRALGFVAPAEATRLRILSEWATPELLPLDLRGSRLWADAAGRMHIRLDPSVVADGRLSLTWFHQNGPTRWGVTLPVGRTRIDFPLSHSTQTLVLARIDPSTTRWESYRWTSPFWRPTWPE